MANSEPSTDGIDDDDCDFVAVSNDDDDDGTGVGNDLLNESYRSSVERVRFAGMVTDVKGTPETISRRKSNRSSDSMHSRLFIKPKQVILTVVYITV